MCHPFKSLLFAMLFATGHAHAQTYPSRPVRFVITSSIGSGVDIVGRVLAEEFTQQFGQQFVVDNRAGAGTNLGMEIAVRAAPDGYTWLLATPALAARLHDLGYVPVGNTPGHLAALVKSEIATMAKVVCEAGITAN